jgi:hypothetical protein
VPYFVLEDSRTYTAMSSIAYSLDVPYNFPLRPAFPDGNPAQAEEAVRAAQQQTKFAQLGDRVDRARTAYAALPIVGAAEMMPRTRRNLNYDRVWQDRVPVMQKADAIMLNKRPVFAEWSERERQLRSDAVIMPIGQVAKQAGISIGRMNDPLSVPSATAHVEKELQVHYSPPTALKDADAALKQTRVPVQFGQARLVYLNPDNAMEKGAVFGRLGHTVPFVRTVSSQREQFFTPVIGATANRDVYKRQAQPVLFRPHLLYAQ